MSEIKKIVQAIYNNEPKLVRENLEAVINNKAAQVVESRKVSIAKNLIAQE